jgi:hypothetical protein
MTNTAEYFAQDLNIPSLILVKTVIQLTVKQRLLYKKK